uniref:Bromodomain adjacent to zinc finger domain, 2A n=1 Tax=Scleropages formosus TaxID=113540 RepID=A0A8C9RQF6_SCLFO
MEANNLFNFGGHPSESANSGLKHSSGDTLYSNGSSMSFPQPSKNMNGDMNVNGITTVIGTSASGSHPSTAYSLMSNHHQSSLGYDYLWDQAQYNPTVSTGHGTGLHPKQGSSGAMQQPQSQPQPQQHFQGHGQYQLNGGVGGASRQSAVAAPPNVTGAGGPYWSRGSPGPQQSTSSMNMSYGASNAYGSYQNQVHPSMTPPQHQQQQQHHQQQPHFGMVSNGMPYYQHQPPPPSPLAATQTQSQASVIPLTAQNLTPSCSSPQLQHHLGHGSSSRHLNEVYKEVDTGYNETDQAPAVQRLPEAEVFTSKPPAPQSVPPSKYCPPAQHTPPDVGQPINKCHSMAVTGADPAASVASPLPVIMVETSSQMADQSGLANEIVPCMEATGDVELVVPHAKIKELEVTERNSLMISQMESWCCSQCLVLPCQIHVRWRREVRVKKCENRLKGETWYYSPCGKRMKQFPEVIKYLNRHQGSVVTREHFSFSPRMPVGDFYEERETPEGMKWFLLADEEVPSIIMAITGRRGRPPNPDKERPRARRAQGGSSKRPGRPPKTRMVDLLSKVDAKLLKRLEAQETLSEEDKEKLNKIKKKMKRKVLRTSKWHYQKDQTGKKKSKGIFEQAGADDDQTPPQPTQEPKKPRRRKREKGVEEKVEEKEDPKRQKRSSGARSKAKALAKAQAEAEAQAQAVLAARRQAERRAQAQRRQEERKRQQLILEELKKPTEDMCLTDHQPLPEFSRVPGVVLSGRAFSHCLVVVEFLQSYGKVLGLQVPRDIPSLSTLQEGLLGLGDSQGEVQDLLVKLVQAALCDPGLPSYYQSVKILGEKLVDLDLNRSSVSEGLRIFLESHAYEAEVCKSLRTKPFQAHSPDTKASILAFLVDELNGSNIVIREIDNTLENMAAYRKNKWTIEGKLRKLKSALARRTGRSEDELGLEDRRRSARVAEEESLGLEDSGLLERSSRRGRKEEVQLSEGESPTTASIPELERQIDKLSKRQVFFRKKLLQASHSLRAMSLGQDRYRRRYWVMPYIGGILVEGPEEDIFVKEDVEPVSSVKTEPKSEPIPEPKLELPLSPTTPLSTNPHLSPVEVDTLPGTASLMSSPRGRGRPRKIKPEVELHLRTAKNRRRRRSIKAASEELTEADVPQRGMQDLTQSAFLSWLSQTEGFLPGGVTGMEVQQGDSGPQESVKEMAEKQGQWFNLLPKNPCDSSSVSQPSIPTSPLKNVPQSPLVPPGSAQLFPDASLCPQVCSTPVLKPGRRRRRRSSAAQGSAARFSFPGANKRRGRPPSKLLQEIEQKYFTQLIVKPIPAAMVRGWWWIREPEELTALLQALHPRGIREKALHKHLSKHMEFFTEFCSRTINPIFQLQFDEGSTLSQTVQQPWKEFEKTMETDISVLQWVEDLEQRVFAADLQIKIAPQNGPSDTDGNTETTAPGFQGFTVPEPDSTREDLQYYDHDVELMDDWVVKTKKEWSNLMRVSTNPLDLAVLRLLNLERNIERRYLKEPLWTPSEVVRLAPLTPIPGEENHLDIESLESEITPRLRAWRQAVDRCRSAAQLSLCLLQLERAIAWEKSVIKVTCLVCKKGDNDEYLLLCDGCDRGCHMYCLRPKVTQVPDGDWFCPVCTSKVSKESCISSRSRKRHVGCYGSGSSDEDDGYKKGMTTRRREGPTVSSYARFSGDSVGSSFSPSKRRRMTTRNQPDLTYCEIILMEMEAHADAWPFLEPVNPRLVPGYRRIIKRPMDFLTMRERLLQGGYCSSEEFAADAQLVFNNCQLFNEDTSEVGMAGHSMRRFFESRWAEFYHKDK